MSGLDRYWVGNETVVVTKGGPKNVGELSRNEDVLWLDGSGAEGQFKNVHVGNATKKRGWLVVTVRGRIAVLDGDLRVRVVDDNRAARSVCVRDLAGGEMVSVALGREDNGKRMGAGWTRGEWLAWLRNVGSDGAWKQGGENKIERVFKTIAEAKKAQVGGFAVFGVPVRRWGFKTEILSPEDVVGRRFFYDRVICCEEIFTEGREMRMEKDKEDREDILVW